MLWRDWILSKRKPGIKKENKRLADDNARLKSIINNDSTNSFLPPSTDPKPANVYNSRVKSGRKAGRQKGHKGTILIKADVEEKIRSGKCRHELRIIGGASGKKYTTKYVVDLEALQRSQNSIFTPRER